MSFKNRDEYAYLQQLGGANPLILQNICCEQKWRRRLQARHGRAATGGARQGRGATAADPAVGDEAGARGKVAERPLPTPQSAIRSR